MNRKEFLLSTLGGLTTMNTLAELKSFADELPQHDKLMPVVFVGHGSPMNGIEDNEFSQGWVALGKSLPVPKAVLVVSAHWYTRGTFISAVEKPKTIYDFQGFPRALYEVAYPAPGAPDVASSAAALVKKTHVTLDHEWGLDHGAWTVVRRMYPEANIPVLQLSIDFTKQPLWHFELARELQQLRKKGVLILGSGNLVHNLRILDWNAPHAGYDWAQEMNETFKKLIHAREHNSLVNYQDLGEAARLSIPTPEHYLPMLYTLGASNANEAISFFNDKTVMGSISMTSFISTAW
jgi:4,5-DOPA dioxygenase extradiol